MPNICLKNVSLEIPILSAERIKITKNMPLNKLGGFFKTDTNNTVNAVKVLNNINLKIESGDKVGLIGPNGAGKSTLLKLLAQIYRPTTGSVEVNGRVCSILDTSLGMNQELSGMENMLLIGMYFGLKKSIIQKSINDIVSFSELGEYVHLPVKRYSSGMITRLSFSVTRILKPDILLLDEVIGTGDIDFTRKTRDNEDIYKKANINILATHNIELMKELCNKAIYLDQGKIVHSGSVDDCFEIYRDSCEAANLLTKKNDKVKVKKNLYYEFLSKNRKYKDTYKKWDTKLDKELSFLSEFLSITQLTIHFCKNRDVIKSRLNKLGLKIIK